LRVSIESGKLKGGVTSYRLQVAGSRKKSCRIGITKGRNE
jgi:hypothetical protein